MKVKFKKLHPEAYAPSYAREGDAGLDLTAVDVSYNPDFQFVEYDIGIAVEIPEGYVGLIYPRSSISKTNLSLCNSVGVIDSSYRGSLRLRFNLDQEKTSIEYNKGDRVGQLIIAPCPKIELEEATSLSESVRSTGGFGSTGS